MIITTEKYKDTHIVYIDETAEYIDDLPAHVGLECLNTSLRIRMLGEDRMDIPRLPKYITEND